MSELTNDTERRSTVGAVFSRAAVPGLPALGEGRGAPRAFLRRLFALLLPAQVCAEFVRNRVLEAPVECRSSEGPRPAIGQVQP